MKRLGTLRTSAITALGLLLLAAGSAAPALASNGPAAELSHGTARFASLAGTSTTFGGWTFTPKKAVIVSAKWKMPPLTCTPATSGVGPIVATINGALNAAGVILECSGGSATATATVVVNGTPYSTGTLVFIGDQMKATVTTSAGTTTATIEDLGPGNRFTFSKSGPGALPTEEWIVDDATNSGGKQLPVANFGEMEFTAGTVGGVALGSVDPRTGVDMETSTGVLQILAGRIRGKDDDSFFTTWKSA